MSVSHVDMQLACRTKALSLTTDLTVPYSRASVASYTDVNGIVQTAAINIPRNAHYVSGVSTVLSESASTNYALQSKSLVTSPWTSTGTTAQNAVGLDGTSNSATTVTDGNAGVICVTQQTVTVANDSNTHVVRYWVGKDSNQTRFPQIGLTLSGGTAQQRRVSLNTQTGAFTGANNIGSGASSVTDLGLWWLIEVSVVNNASGNTSAILTVHPAARSVISGSDDATVTGSVVIAQAQLEKNASTGTSPIFTTTVAVTRAADLGSVFAATTTGYTRTDGSFSDDGFAIGTEITPSGFAANVTAVVTDVSALSITTRSTHAAEDGLLGRSFAIGLPSDFAWENLRFTPTQGVPYVKEEYLPGPMSLNSMGTGGDVTVEPTYRLTVFVPQNSGISADGTYADALINLFAPSTEMLLPDGNVLFVRADVSPIRGQRVQQQGLSGIPVTIPLRAFINNADTENPFYVVFTDLDGDIAISSSITAALGDYQTVTIDDDDDPAAP